MTINKVITDLKISNREKVLPENVCKWCHVVDMHAAEIMGIEPPPEYTQIECGDQELLIEMPYDEVYFYYCAAKEDLNLRMYSDYNNMIQIYASKFDEWAKNYRRKNPPTNTAGFII